MTITTLSSRELNQDIGRAKKAAERGPVLITHRGRPSHVLLTVEEYERLVGRERTIVELLGMPGAEDVDFEIPRLAPADIRAALAFAADEIALSENLAPAS